jgi:tRNA(Glu) U13 pseudouridine synthase TruD
MSSEGFAAESWRIGKGLRARGARRPLRVPLDDWQIDYDEGLVVRFSLPSGAYASNVLAEIIKG